MLGTPPSLIAPHIQIFKLPTELFLKQPLNKVWVPEAETKSGAWLEICHWKRRW